MSELKEERCLFGDIFAGVRNNDNYIIIIIMKITIRTGLLQKTALLGTGRILRKVLES